VFEGVLGQGYGAKGSLPYCLILAYGAQREHTTTYALVHTRIVLFLALFRVSLVSSL
jgi:hypothetical protein